MHGDLSQADRRVAHVRASMPRPLHPWPLDLPSPPPPLQDQSHQSHPQVLQGQALLVLEGLCRQQEGARAAIPGGDAEVREVLLPDGA
jgi:hypothetical protein